MTWAQGEGQLAGGRGGRTGAIADRAWRHPARAGVEHGEDAGQAMSADHDRMVVVRGGGSGRRAADRGSEGHDPLDEGRSEKPELGEEAGHVPRTAAHVGEPARAGHLGEAGQQGPIQRLVVELVAELPVIGRRDGVVHRLHAHRDGVFISLHGATDATRRLRAGGRLSAGHRRGEHGAGTASR